MSPAARIAAFGLGFFCIHFILGIGIHFLISTAYVQEQRLLEKNINKELVKLEIDRFRDDFFSGRATTSMAINGTCLQEKDKQLKAFQHCKTSKQLRLKYSVNSTFLDSAYVEHYDVQEFCVSMEKHRQCMEDQAKIVCSVDLQSSASIVLPLLSLCGSLPLARLRHSYIWLIIGLDVPKAAKNNTGSNGQLNNRVGQAAPEISATNDNDDGGSNDETNQTLPGSSQV
ncbi:hypothetical protein TYRP_017549 [Tyrophagus putrescentiae]|nr:hypothetical protein TYRP_017549 [Tyrophagus putrescentiae]